MGKEGVGLQGQTVGFASWPLPEPFGGASMFSSVKRAGCAEPSLLGPREPEMRCLAFKDLEEGLKRPWEGVDSGLGRWWRRGVQAQGGLVSVSTVRGPRADACRGLATWTQKWARQAQTRPRRPRSPVGSTASGQRQVSSGQGAREPLR